MKAFLKFIIILLFAALTFGPSIYIWRNGPIAGLNLPTTDFSDFDFLAVCIALATYVSGVRFLLIQRMQSGTSTLAKVMILALIPADFHLILCSLVMAAKVFWVDLFGAAGPDPWLPYVAFFFVYSSAYLAMQLVIAWFISVVKFCKP
jgi:hypothetical protein